ncbi:hypothetical protein OA961_01620 [Candidatus Pelagibacter sp.]|nr:hypothetical protein [Candidatus Pelagibacter sp.]|tara:strand:- start:279 stop:671 length:393 start_codon:yes stop_codon:yes gene_type:complete
MLNVRGYIFSRSFFGERVPQHIQNIVIRDFCKKNKLNYNLSLVEYAMKDSYTMFNQIINQIDKFDGVVLYSLFQLPKSDKVRNNLCNNILNKNKKIYFANENRVVKSKFELEKINIIWKLKQKIPEKFIY